MNVVSVVVLLEAVPFGFSPNRTVSAELYVEFCRQKVPVEDGFDESVTGD